MTLKNRTIRLPEELDKILQVNAENANITQAEYIRRIIQEGLDSDRPGKLLEELTWFHLQHKLLMGLAYIISVDTDIKIHEAINQTKRNFPALFDLKEKEPKRNRMDHEQFLLEQIDDIVETFKLSESAKFTLSTLFLTVTSIIHDGQIFEPFGLSLSWIEQFQKIK